MGEVVAVIGNYQSGLYFVLLLSATAVPEEQLLACCRMGDGSIVGVRPGTSVDVSHGLLYQMRPPGLRAENANL